LNLSWLNIGIDILNFMQHPSISHFVLCTKLKEGNYQFFFSFMFLILSAT
jgi:hypothetical protein